MNDILDIDVDRNIPPEANWAMNLILRRKSSYMDEDFSGDGLESALNALARRVGFELKIPGELVGDRESILYKIASYSGFRIQKMMLTDKNWWKKDNGPLLAVNKENNRCYALLPISTGGYRTHHEISVKITQENANQFEDVVYGFFLPFPDRQIHLSDVLKLSLNTSRFEITSILLTQITLVFLGLLTPILFGTIVDSAIPLSDKKILDQVIFGLMAATLSGLILTLLQSIAFLRIKLKSNNFIEAALWERLLRIPLSFYREYGIGEIVDRLRGFDIINASINTNFLQTLLNGLWSILSLGIICYYDTTVALILILISVVLCIFLITTALTQLYYNRKIQHIEGRSSSLLLQIISGIKKIKTTNSERVFYNRWLEQLTAHLTYFIKANSTLIIVKAFQSYIMIISTLIIYSHFVSLNSGTTGITLGTFITINALMGTFVVAFVGFTTSLLSYIHLIPYYDRIKPILNAVPESRDREHMASPLAEIHKIELKDVSFSYENTSFQTISNLDLTIKKGQFIAVVGSSGSGKSTLIRLLLGLEEPQDGKILYDGIDIKQMPIQWVRSQYGVVLQSTNLISGSIFDNITGFDNTLTPENVKEAIQLANLTADIKKLPMGLQTLVMDNGGGLSLGQRQRILIARALCHRPKILILDEATSALDSLNQKIIHENIDKLGITRFVVAHRLTTIQRADLIYVLHKGRLVESGTYQKLLEKKGHFTKIMM